MSFSTVVLAIGMVACSVVFYHFQLHSGPSQPSLIKGYIPFLGVAKDLLFDPRDLFNRAYKRCGWIYSIYAGGHKMIIVTDPIHGMKQVMTQTRIFGNEDFFSYLDLKLFKYTKRVDSDVQFMSDLRNCVMRNVSPPLNQRCIEELRAHFRDLVGPASSLYNEVGREKNGKIVDAYDLSRVCMIKAAALAMFGDQFPTDEILAPYTIFENNIAKYVSGIPGIFLKSIYEARAEVLRLLGKFSTEFELTPDSPNFIGGIYKIFKDNGKYTEEEDFAGYFLSILFASMSNSVPAACWYLMFMLNSPGMIKKIECIIQDHVDQKSGELDWKSVYELPELESAFKETVRLTSNVTLNRYVTNDTKVKIAQPTDNKLYKEYNLNKGDNVIIFTSLSHWNEEAFPDPMTFYPQRFLPGNKSLLPHEKLSVSEQDDPGNPAWKSYIPWGGGKHMCPGRHLAKVEAISQLIYLISYYQITPQLQSVPEMSISGNFGTGAIRPLTDYPIKLEIREKPLMN
ncbi:cytochrome P450 [Lipomyces oligophaga]|uniref:cytochrome P450 n=1 Tax=Lipomyces oligophaga TaxID=45792 RepID=UPI0034CF0325